MRKRVRIFMIGFNPKFLMDALRVIDDETVDIYLVNPKAPCFIRDDKETYIYLILPVNFNGIKEERTLWKQLQLRDEFIKLGQALKLAGLCESGVDAKFAIQEGHVTGQRRDGDPARKETPCRETPLPTKERR